MPGPYSAGSVFLEVVPVFKDVQNEIGRQAEDIGTALGDKMSGRAEKELEKNLPRAVDRALDNPAIGKAAEDAGKTTAERYGGAFRNALARSTKNAMASMGKELDAAVGDGRKRLEALNKLTLEPDLDSSKALGELVKLEAELRAAGENMDLTLEVRVDAENVANDVAAIRRGLDTAGITIDVDVDTAAAMVKLARLDRDRKVELKVDVDSSKLSLFERMLGGTSGRLRNLDRDGDLAANSFRGFNGMLLTAVSIGPLLIPILAALSGGVLALGTSFAVAATGLIPLALGLAGIGTAVGALADVEKNSAKDSASYARTLRTASNGVRDAQISLSRAREAAGESAEASSRRIGDALRAEEDAQRDLTRAQEAAERAQERLVRARQEAQDQLEDMALRLRGGALAERQAVIDLFEAQVAYRNALADPGATNLEREQATIAYERQSLALEQIRLENGRLKESSAEAATAGVEGSEQVVSAQDEVARSNEGVADAQQRVTDAAQASADAQAAAARDQRDSARAIEDAQRSLTDAQTSYNDALFRTGDIGSSAAQKLEQAMAKLSPAGQAFALWIFSLRGGLQDIRDIAQEGLLPGLQTGLQTLIDQYGPGFQQFVGTMSSLLGTLASELGDTLTTPVWQEFFGMIGEYAPVFLRQWASIGTSLATGFAAIMTAAAPFAKTIGDIWVALFEQFAQWASSPEGAEFIQSFLAEVARVTPDVLRFVGALAGAFITLVEALAPYADVLLQVFTGLLDFIAGLDPQILGIVIAGIFILITAFQLMLSIFAGAGLILQVLFAVISGAVGSTFALVAAGVVLIIGAFVLLYTHSETFRAAVAVVWDWIKLAWAALVDGIVWYVDNILLPTWRVIGAVLLWVWENVLSPIFRALWEGFKYAGETISWVVTDVIGPVFELLGAIAKKIWEMWLKPFVDDVVWSWENQIKPVFDAIGGWISEHVEPKFRAAMEALGDAWYSFIQSAQKPVRFVIEQVINRGIIENFNKLADVFGTSHITPMALPPGFDNPPARSNRGAGSPGGANIPGFATGGQVGGYSPSPTADNIPAWLTAGEHIQPVSSVRRYGADLFEAFRHGLIDPFMARMLLPGFAGGGLVDFGRVLQSMGFRVGEHPAFGGVHPVHMKNSLHYKGQAIDVNWAPGTSAAEQAKIDSIIPMAMQYGLGAIWRMKNHFDHAHFENSDYRAIGSGGADVGIVGRIVGAAKALFDDPLGFLRGAVQKVTGELADNPFGAMLLGGVGKMVDSAIDFVTGNAPGETVVEPTTKTRLYDTGGIVPPGLSGVLNLTGGNEHLGILTNDQWATLQRTADGEAGGTYIDLTLEAGTPNEAIEAVLFALRHSRRGGVYAQKG